jgi:hypothetical protein
VEDTFVVRNAPGDERHIGQRVYISGLVDSRSWTDGRTKMARFPSEVSPPAACGFFPAA